jgi:hypothetical protein
VVDQSVWKGEHMRTAALVFGITGGVFGILAGLLAMMVGGIGSAFEAEGSGSVAGLGFAAILLGVLGIVGGALSNRSPGKASLIQAIAGLFGFIAISLFWVLAGVLLLVGALLAFLGRGSQTTEPTGQYEAAADDRSHGPATNQ